MPAVAYLESAPVGVEPIRVAELTKDMVDDRFEIVGCGVYSPDE